MPVVPDPRSRPEKDCPPITSVEAGARGNRLSESRDRAVACGRWEHRLAVFRSLPAKPCSHLPVPIRAGESQPLVSET